jgi:hypothetical protein
MKFEIPDSSYKFRLWFAIGALAVGTLAVSLVLLTPSSAPATPTIGWTPTSVNQTVLAGQSKSVTLSFTASATVSNVVVQVVPALQPFVQTTPTQFLSITKGQPIQVTVTFSAPATALPSTVQGAIQLRSRSGNNINTLGQPLPVTINITWATFNTTDLSVAFQYPTFGHPSQTTTQAGADGTLRVSVLATDATPPLLQYVIGFTPNPTHLSLLQWFAEQIDLSGAILAGGGYQLTTLPNGVQVLILTGELPTAHLDCCGPIDDLYALSPSGATIMTVSTGQEHSFGAIGGSPDELRSLYLAMLASVTAP